MAYLQERVIAYVVADPNLFVAEERSLHYGNGLDDNWWVDILIVDPWKQLFYLGEVTYDPRPHRLIEKLKVFAERKSEVLGRIGRTGAPPGWEIRPWIFVRKDSLSYVTSRLPTGLFPRITYLESTAHPWEYEKIRKTGAEPDRPYQGLEDHYQD